ncbi:MAG: hypothetical protein FWE40_03865 [Oscillospiraceae bacterium]|nr:hypothetical protein [Oscillospiraceae bacterium]
MKEILRQLVGEYMQYATLPVQQEKTALWRALNRCDMQRPMITIDQLPWHELACNELTCQIEDPYWRGVEQTLRQTLYKWRNFPADMVLDPFIALPKAVTRTGYGIVAQTDYLGISQHFTNQLVELSDTEKIKDEVITHDEVLTAQIYAQAQDMFGDLAPIRMVGISFHLGVWDKLTTYMGVDECYYAFYDNPELLHAAMNRMTESTIAGIAAANQLGLHNDNQTLCHCSHVFTDELLSESGAGRGATSQHCWSFGLAQLMTATSPDIFEEFELPYISRMAEYFGAVYYGCCDKLDDRLHLVKRIPNLRKVSCSPWSNKENFAAQLGPQLVLSAKPNPAFLAGAAMNEDEIRRELQQYCALAKQHGLSVEFLLKDVSTVAGDPGRLSRWADIAMCIAQA